MGWHVYEEICAQWLRRHAQTKLGLSLQEIGRYWSRDGRIEIDLMAKVKNAGLLYGERKWSSSAAIGRSVYSSLRAKIAMLPDPKWRQDAACVLFSVGGFTAELQGLAANPDERLFLVGGDDLLSTSNV